VSYDSVRGARGHPQRPKFVTPSEDKIYRTDMRRPAMSLLPASRALGRQYIKLVAANFLRYLLVRDFLRAKSSHQFLLVLDEVGITEKRARCGVDDIAGGEPDCP